MDKYVAPAFKSNKGPFLFSSLAQNTRPMHSLLRVRASEQD